MMEKLQWQLNNQDNIIIFTTSYEGIAVSATLHEGRWDITMSVSALIAANPPSIELTDDDIWAFNVSSDNLDDTVKNMVVKYKKHLEEKLGIK
jgi:hypothetical protein